MLYSTKHEPRNMRVFLRCETARTNQRMLLTNIIHLTNLLDLQQFAILSSKRCHSTCHTIFAFQISGHSTGLLEDVAAMFTLIMIDSNGINNSQSQRHRFTALQCGKQRPTKTFLKGLKEKQLVRAHRLKAASSISYPNFYSLH